MKKELLALTLIIVLASCNNEGTSEVRESDTIGQKNPDGIVNSNRISTDSGAYNVDSTDITPRAEKLTDSVFNKKQ